MANDAGSRLACCAGMWLRWCTLSAAKRTDTFHSEKQMATKPFFTFKRPTGKTPKIIDPDNPPWTADMVGPPVYRYGGRILPDTESLPCDAEVFKLLRNKRADAQTGSNRSVSKAARKKGASRATRHR